MGIPGIAVQPAGEDNSGSAVRFLIEWVSAGEAGARSYLAGHAEPEGASLVAAHGHDVIGYAAIVRESSHAGFRTCGLPDRRPRHPAGRAAPHPGDRASSLICLPVRLAHPGYPDDQ